jgi:hypothetical protein
VWTGGDYPGASEWGLIVQEYAEEAVIDRQCATVVVDKAKLPEHSPRFKNGYPIKSIRRSLS